VLAISSLGMPAEAVTRLQTEQTYEALAEVKSVRSALANEQAGRCCYCEARLVIRDAYHNTKIEHFHPRHNEVADANCARQSGASSKTTARVSWQNVLLSCDGGRNFGSSTCDDSKAGTDVCGVLRNPKAASGLDTLVTVLENGRVIPRDAVDMSRAQLYLDDVLHLNDRHLVEVRRRIMLTLLKGVRAEKARRRGLSAALKGRIADGLRRDAEANEYASVYLSLASRLAP
jgi:uncharacterized protein (TIGR02646 family)